MSTKGQLLDRQIAALTAAGCTRVFTDKKSGKNAEREELWKCLDYLRPGDTLVLTPTAERFFHGTLSRPPAGWVKAVLAGHQVLLLGGDIGGLNGDADQQREALAVAAKGGQLAGARIACGRPSDFNLS